MNREACNHLLQHCSSRRLSDLAGLIGREADIVIIRKPTPQTILVPVKDPINTGIFYGGEVLVTSAIVTVNGTSGWAMVLDDSPELAQHIAVLDGAYGAEVRKQEIITLAEAGREHLDREIRENAQRSLNTRVSFDLL